MSIWIRWEGAALGTKKIEGKNDKTGGPGIWLCVCILCLVSLSQQGFLAGGPDASGIAHTCPIRAVKLRRVWGRGGGQEEKEIHGGPRRRRAERVFPLESSHRSSGKNATHRPRFRITRPGRARPASAVSLADPSPPSLFIFIVIVGLSPRPVIVERSVGSPRSD